MVDSGNDLCQASLCVKRYPVLHYGNVAVLHRKRKLRQVNSMVCSNEISKVRPQE